MKDDELWGHEVPDDERTTTKDVVMRRWGMRLRASLIRINWSDKYQYLWQNKLGQHSLIEFQLS